MNNFQLEIHPYNFALAALDYFDVMVTRSKHNKKEEDAARFEAAGRAMAALANYLDGSENDPEDEDEDE